MGRIQKGVRLVVGRRRSRKDGEAGEGERLTKRRVIEFPKPRAADEIVRDRIIFDIGGDRFDLHDSSDEF